MKYDVVALGELLIDFTENGFSEQGNPVFEANPGGAPCNVLAMLQKLGKKTAFIGKVGSEQFGIMLKQAIEREGIASDNLIMDSEINTTLAFVHTMADGDRDFSFYRKPGADMMLTASEVSTELIRNAEIFHFGTLSMTDEPVCSATVKAVETAKDNGVLLSFDPNLREALWKDLEEAKAKIRYGLSVADIVKLSEEELEFITGIKDVEHAAEVLRVEYPMTLLLVTMGKHGSCAFYKDIVVTADAYLQKGTIETTGAGDTFHASVLFHVLNTGLENFKEKELLSMLRFANAGASIITTRRGALAVMPEMEEVLRMVSLAEAE